jgi:hypothetical protein
MQRPCVLDDEECRRKVAQWVRINASVKGKPNMTAATFQSWVNQSLLPLNNLDEKFSKTNS